MECVYVCVCGVCTVVLWIYRKTKETFEFKDAEKIKFGFIKDKSLNMFAAGRLVSLITIPFSISFLFAMSGHMHVNGNTFTVYMCVCVL